MKFVIYLEVELLIYILSNVTKDLLSTFTVIQGDQELNVMSHCNLVILSN